MTKARKKNLGINTVDILFELYYWLFDFLVILLDAPSFIWHGWLKVLNNDEICGVKHDTVYGIYMHLALGVLFYITIKTLKELLKLPLFAYETIIDRRYGLANTSCLSFFIAHTIDIFVKLF